MIKKQIEYIEWTSVKDRLPGEDGEYLVTIEYTDDYHSHTETDKTWFYEGVKWEKTHKYVGCGICEKVTAWAEKPEPYKG